MASSASNPRLYTAIDALTLASTLRERVTVQDGAGARAETDALLEQMRNDRLVWAMAPVERGGLGASFSDMARITARLARISGSLGLLYAMHASQAYTLLRHGDGSAHLEALTDRLIADQALVASGTSEKGVGGDVFGSTCVVEEHEDGALSVTKESPNISYLNHAGAVLVTAMRTTPTGKTQVLIAAETSRLAFESGPEAQMMGLRGMLNRPYSFTAQFAPGAVFSEDYPCIARETMTPTVHVLWAAMWSGLAAQALEKAKAFVAKSPPSVEGGELMRIELSRLVNKHYTMNALVREAAVDFYQSDLDDSPPLDLARTANIKRLKVVCSELLEEICLGALGVIGFAAYAERGKFSLSEIIRDALSARVMISNNRLLLANGPIERFIDDAL